MVFPTTLSTVFLTVMVLPGIIATDGETVSLPPGRYEAYITSSSYRYHTGDPVWEGAFLLTQEETGGDPNDNYFRILQGINNPVIIDLSNKTGNTDVTGFLVKNRVADSPSGSVSLQLRLLHN